MFVILFDQSRAISAISKKRNRTNRTVAIPQGRFSTLEMSLKISPAPVKGDNQVVDGVEDAKTAVSVEHVPLMNLESGCHEAPASTELYTAVDVPDVKCC